MTNKTTKNGKSAFQEKLSMAQLRTEVLQNKLTPAEIISKYNITGYTLQNKLYTAACQASNKTEAVHFLMEVPSEVSTRIERKKSLVIPSKLCDLLTVEVGTKFDVSQNDKTGKHYLDPSEKII